ncbi:hypothetical protein J6590_050465 [Homalodisca vitripennis]|nr:hypothetical protein J6590_050465 [Homalodisca vitripennis]
MIWARVITGDGVGGSGTGRLRLKALQGPNRPDARVMIETGACQKLGGSIASKILDAEWEILETESYYRLSTYNGGVGRCQTPSKSRTWQILADCTDRSPKD